MRGTAAPILTVLPDEPSGQVPIGGWVAAKAERITSTRGPPTDRAPKPGRPELELAMGGTVWRFRNEGNRAAFAEHPDVYTPQFGGYDPVAVARGASVPGHPLFWAVTGERLYLFYSDKARAEFLADPGRVIDRATRKWPALARSIAR